jgi:hypothetical protein
MGAAAAWVVPIGSSELWRVKALSAASISSRVVTPMSRVISSPGPELPVLSSFPQPATMPTLRAMAKYGARIRAEVMLGFSFGATMGRPGRGDGTSTVRRSPAGQGGSISSITRACEHRNLRASLGTASPGRAHFRMETRV